MFALLLGAGALYAVHRRSGRSAGAVRLRHVVGVDRGHPARPQRARARCPARSDEPARAGGARRRSGAASPGAKSCAATSLVLAKAIACRPTALLVAGGDDCRSTSRCSPANRCRCASSRRADARDADGAGRRRSAVCLFRHTGGARHGTRRRARRPAPAARSARSGASLGGIEAEPPRLQAQTRELVRDLRAVGLHVERARRSCSTACCAASWLQALLAASRSACRCCPRNSRWC